MPMTQLKTKEYFFFILHPRNCKFRKICRFHTKCAYLQAGEYSSHIEILQLTKRNALLEDNMTTIRALNKKIKDKTAENVTIENRTVKLSLQVKDLEKNILPEKNNNKADITKIQKTLKNRGV